MLFRTIVLVCALVAPFWANAGEVAGTATHLEQIIRPLEARPPAVFYTNSNNAQVKLGQFETTADAVRLIQTNASGFDPEEPTLMSGMMTYMADAALFEDCRSGARVPIAQEAEYLALERAYLANRRAAGEPLFVTIIGAISMRDAMEGPRRETLIVDQFISTNQTTNCERQHANASLENTYWRLDMLNGVAVAQSGAKGEPHIILNSASTGTYRAMLGCNSITGSVTINGSNLRFSARASTMMACPNPLPALEAKFGLVLSQVVRSAIIGETLVLSDANAQPIAVFTAVYF